MTILDTLSPERFAEEFPFLLENLALEFPQIRIMIAPENLAFIAADLRAGLRARPVDEQDAFLPSFDVMDRRAKDGLPLQVDLNRETALLFAGDLERGMKIRKTSGTGEARTPAE